MVEKHETDINVDVVGNYKTMLEEQRNKKHFEKECAQDEAKDKRNIQHNHQTIKIDNVTHINCTNGHRRVLQSTTDNQHNVEDGFKGRPEYGNRHVGRRW